MLTNQNSLFQTGICPVCRNQTVNTNLSTFVYKINLLNVAYKISTF